VDKKHIAENEFITAGIAIHLNYKQLNVENLLHIFNMWKFKTLNCRMNSYLCKTFFKKRLKSPLIKAGKAKYC
jgi:hypothetical protein